MATIAIFGGTGYAGSAIRDEALRRGHTVISVSRKEAELAGTPGFISREGNLHDPALVDHMAAEADVVVVAIRAGQQDGVRLADAVTMLTKAAAEHSTRLGFVGGAGSLHVTEGGPRLVDLPTFPDAHKTPQGFDLSNRVHPGLFAMTSCQGTLTLPDGHVPDGPAIRGSRKPIEGSRSRFGLRGPGTV